MTNVELIAKIKAEIERRLANYHPEFVNHGLASGFREDGKAIAYEELLSFLSTLESEKPMNLEEEINRYLHEECSDDDEPGIHEIAEHFAKWGAEHLDTSGKTISVKPGDEVAINGHKIVYDKAKGYVTIVKSEESVPNDLEEAAERSLRLVGFHNMETRGMDWKGGFISGAKWQKEQNIRDMYMSDNRHYEKVYQLGKKDMKDQFMKKAVEKTVCLVPSLVGPKMFTTSIELSADELKGLYFGDKVCVIVLKKED